MKEMTIGDYAHELGMERDFVRNTVGALRLLSDKVEELKRHQQKLERHPALSIPPMEPAPPPSQTQWRNLLERIDSYLENGGLFNPEIMEQEKVRDLILDCRDALRCQETKP